MLSYQLFPAITDPLPIIVTLPHCGMVFPDDLRECRSAVNPALDTDGPLDRLLDFLPESGIALLKATYSRYVVDVNRPVQDPVPGPYKVSVIPDRDATGLSLFAEPPSEAELQDRLYRHYIPYHEALYLLLMDRVRLFGAALLIDLHSFDSSAPSADIVFSDGYGQYCSEAVVACFEKHHQRVGLETRRNEPIPAGYCVRHYSRIPGVMALHLEVKRRTFAAPLFEVARHRYRQVYQAIAQEITPILHPSIFRTR